MQLPASIGKYELLDFLGGGMSHVYRAHDSVIDRPVVVKILTGDGSSDPEAKARFLQEARLAGNIQHPNIVSVFDYGEYMGCPYIVMEYLKGEDLRGAIRGNRAGSILERLRIARDIASALEFVHARGIVHRDIKPENIHIDAAGKVKLMDFGIAKTADLSLTRTGMAMGTPYYMAPEQVRGQPVTVLVDIYAWGLLLYELLTGMRSVNAESMEAVFYQILNVPVDQAAMENAGSPPAVRDLVARCTSKDPAARPQTFGAIIEELGGLLAGEGASRTQIRPPGGAGGSATGLSSIPTSWVAAQSEQPLQAAEAAPAGFTASNQSYTGVAIVAAAVFLIALAVGAYLKMSPKPVPEIAGMVYIPAGTFLAGADKHPVQLRAFYIDQTEVTNAQFAEYCRATGCTAPTAAADLPVVNINVAQARAFAQWKKKRLPSGPEWERATRGDKGAKFPWGDEADPFRANVSDNSSTGAEHHLMPVKSFPTPSGIYDLVGNAFEMVDGPVKPSEAVVARFAPLLTPAATAQEPWIALRGGSFNTPLSPDLVWDQASVPERFAFSDLGFRCAKDPAR